MREPIIFNIQRMSMHDGPGVRTTIFFKGCSLRCQWCHNPESINPKIEIEWKPYQCMECGDCIAACDSHARYIEGGEVTFRREKCAACGKCAEACVTGASVIAGKHMAVDEIVEEAEKDLEMYRITGGGVTCSGGEPLLQAEAVAEILRRLKQKGIHTAVDTAGNVPWTELEKVLPVTDLFLFDIKHMDSGMHRKFTGASNEQILKNFCSIPEDKEIFVRVPVVKGVNDKSLKEIADFLKDRKNVRLVELLPYHALGATKYEGLGQEGKKFAPPDMETLEEAMDYFKECRLYVKSSANG